MIPKTPIDITGDDHQHTLASILGVSQCKWFRVTGLSISRCTVGDSTIEADGGGFQVTTTQAFETPPIALGMSFYDLNEWYLLLALNDIASVGCAI